MRAPLHSFCGDGAFGRSVLHGACESGLAPGEDAILGSYTFGKCLVAVLAGHTVPVAGTGSDQSDKDDER